MYAGAHSHVRWRILCGHGPVGESRAKLCRRMTGRLSRVAIKTGNTTDTEYCPPDHATIPGSCCCRGGPQATGFKADMVAVDTGRYHGGRDNLRLGDAKAPAPGVPLKFRSDRNDDTHCVAPYRCCAPVCRALRSFTDIRHE